MAHLSSSAQVSLDSKLRVSIYYVHPFLSQQQWFFGLCSVAAFMGSNQSKFSKVLVSLARIANRDDWPTPRMVKVKIDSIHFTTTTSEKAMQQEREKRLSKPWKEQLLAHGRPLVYTINDAFFEHTTVLVAAAGVSLFGSLFETHHTVFHVAATFMWLLEERVKRPWSVL